jgi:hypothetical protein
MIRSLFVAFVAAAFLLAPAMLPQVNAPGPIVELSGAAQAATVKKNKKVKVTKRTRRPKEPKQPSDAPISTPGGY